MLGRLARWLRIAGFDTLYYREKQDDELLEESVTSNRVLVSRDKTLIQRANKREIEAFLIVDDNTVDQLIHIKNGLKIEMTPTISRCPVCNGELEKKTRDEIIDSVPMESLNAYDEFWRCSGCNRVYWKGSHWTQIIETFSTI